MLKDHYQAIEAEYKKKPRTFSFSDLQSSLQALENHLVQHFLDNGFSNTALSITDHAITIFDFARFSHDQTKYVKPILEFNTSLTTQTAWDQAEAMLNWKFLSIGETFSFRMKETEINEPFPVLECLYKNNLSAFRKHIETIVIQAILFSYKRQYTPAHEPELIYRDLSSAIQQHDLLTFLPVWIKADTYFQERISALASVVMSHIQSNNYFNDQLRKFSGKLPYDSLFHYSRLAESVDKSLLEEVLTLAESDFFSSYILLKIGLNNVSLLISKDADLDNIHKRIRKLSTTEFLDLVQNQFMSKCFVSLNPSQYNLVFTLSIVFGVELVARYYKLIQLVVKDDMSNAYKRLTTVFKLLCSPSSFIGLEINTMPMFLTNQQPIVNGDDECSYDLSNFNQIYDGVIPSMLNTFAKNYELEQFIKKGRFDLFFNLNPSNTIFSKSLFDGITLQGANIAFVSNSAALLDLCKDTSLNLNHLCQSLKDCNKYVFRVEVNSQVYALCFDEFDGHRLLLNTEIIPLPNNLDAQRIISDFTQQLVHKRKYIRESFRYSTN